MVGSTHTRMEWVLSAPEASAATDGHSCRRCRAALLCFALLRFGSYGFASLQAAAAAGWRERALAEELAQLHALLDERTREQVL